MDAGDVVVAAAGEYGTRMAMGQTPGWNGHGHCDKVAAHGSDLSWVGRTPNCCMSAAVAAVGKAGLRSEGQ